MAGPTTPRRIAVLYDRGCAFCRWSVGALLALDRAGALRPVAIQAAEGERLLAAVPAAERLDSVRVVGPDGLIAAGGDAAAPVAAALPGGRLTAPLARGASPALRALYRAVSARRARLGRLLPRSLVRAADAAIARRGGATPEEPAA